MKRTLFIFLILFSAGSVFSQRTRFSIATDLDIQRSFKKDQQYWGLGQSIDFHFHFTPKDGAYAWVAYYSYGNITNNLTATAKQPTTVPQDINYVNHSELRFKHISLGWKHYFKGTSDAENKWNLYYLAGFGIMLGRVNNLPSTFIDTSQYVQQVLPGTANFKRLTFDVGLGWEQPLGGDIFLYVDGRLLIPTSDYPSPYLYVNKNAPLEGSLNIGFRFLFFTTSSFR